MRTARSQFLQAEFKRAGRRGRGTLVTRALAVGLTTAMVVLFMPTTAFAVGVAPSAPVQPTVATGNGSLAVAFVAPADGGSPITGYTATCTDGVTPVPVSGPSSAITVSPLINGSSYACTVHATNLNGNSPESPASSSLIVGAPSQPAQPTLTHGDGAMSVAFLAPAANGSAIQLFNVVCLSSDGGTSGSASDVASPVLVSALDNGKTYTCRVSATNGNGTGAASIASASAVPAGLPDSPLKPTVTRGNTQISVAFSAPANNGSAITGYSTTCTSSNGGTSGSLSGSASPLVVTGLTNGKTYTCKVLASNAEGSSDLSVASSVTVPATVPAAPAQPTVTHGAASATVTFVAPTDNGGSVIVGYTATCSSSNGGTTGSNASVGSPIVVSALTNAKTYTCTVHATNAVGDSVESVQSATVFPATVPAAPAQPTVTRGNAQISVAFVAPANNGSTITGYTAACTSGGGGAFGSHSGGTSPIVVSSLTNGQSYTCTVFATNSEGDGPQSVASASAVPATVPGAPAQPTVTHGNASISVAFSAPVSTGGSAITGYTATCTSGDGGTSGSNSDVTSPVVVSVLTNGKTYTCTVLATNATGAGAASIPSASTVPATIPSAPAPPAVTHGNALISVAFSLPVSDGGSAITGYTATCTDGVTPVSQSGPTSPITVTGLTNGSSYTCTVHATNAEGNSLESSASASTVPATAPSAPAQPSISITGTTITVTFVAPSNGGNAISGYSVSCTSSDGGASGSNSGATSPITVTNATLGKSYTCTVLATNAEGPSPVSVPSAPATVPAIAPSTPSAPTVTRGAAAISVAFVAPFDGGSVITGYTATCTDGVTPVSQSGPTSPITVSGLTNGSSYTCTVLATNSVGGGSASTASAAVTPAAVPSAPSAPTLTHGNAQISVAFVPPADNGNAITQYSVSCTSSNLGVAGGNVGASSPIVVSALDNGKTYTCTVLATNSLGNGLPSPASAPTVPATVPDAPATPGVTRGNAQISVAFVAPFDGGSAITGYTATCTDGVTPVTHSGPSSPIAVTGLADGSSYTCTVHATNAEGDSPESGASASAVPATVPSPPAQPTTIAAATHIAVSFVAPANGGAVITGYTASCVSTDGGVSGSNAGASSPVSVASLSKGKSYNCTVHATNAVGDSGESPVSAATVIPATVPDAPAKPVTTIGNGQISVAFVVPSDGGSAITGYSANCTSIDGGVPGSHSGGSSPIVVTGLDNGKTYTCAVLATNALGDSDASVASDATIPATVPGTPAAPTLTRGNASISVAIVAPANGGSPITGYTAACVSSDGGVSGSNSGASSPVVVLTLTNGKTYTCTALATNAAGSGAASAASATAIPATVPGAPAAPTGTRGNASISVAFVAPVSDGGSPITGYTAACVSSDGGATGSNSGPTSPIVVSTLDNGKTYTCTVLATNAVGGGSASPASVSTVPATVPNAPAAPTLSRGNTSISVAIVAPATGGSAITAYMTSCTSSDGGTAGNNSGATSPIVVSSLTNGKTYTCTVHATNAVGDSLESAASGSAVPATVPTAPAQPTAVRGIASASVSFVAPANGGSAIIGYTAVCTSSDGGVMGINNGATSPIVVSSLTDGKTYTCTVLATNGVGNGTASVASAPVVPSSMPSIPRKPTIARGNAQLVVSFLRTPNGGSILTGYTVTCTSTDGGILGVQAGLMSPITVTGLTNGAVYMCTVHATNANGSGSESVNSLAGRVGVPLANLHVPTIMGLPIDHHRLTVNNGSWRGAPVPRFSYRWRRCNLSVTVCVDIPLARARSLVLRPADIGHKIRVIVTATNIFGSVVMRTRATAEVIDS